ncbi:DNA damage-inducible protein D [Actinobacillus succinogenes]|uniref:DNA-damage-inducible protein n=1 Tax=Actinobacillus succinogenes (strain ATCC 55618 / DSM 22257 / CCUG 43843 / 130Z) TaxID=339671 RepID=A6VPU6_ACTSZ|nr:DNA damage-inducible protein D [Actinobacillus succinogenes]ABR74993.1 DNA-damage-inducible protein [Actinobacillus succinogenes 130Z]PHI40599.1 DNA damage-inducible protein D [Actinobacillus succinogenes]
MNELTQTFEGIKQVDEQGNEFWSARELAPILEYKKWQNFQLVIQKAIVACETSNINVSYHFTEISKMVRLGSGSQRQVGDFLLSRYACYLIVQNGDPSKPVIAAGQTYFAVQTRRQELADDENFQQLQEDQKRLFLRNELKEHNKQLVKTAQKAGVASNLDFAIFQNHGYKGLYGGLDNKAIHARKGLKANQKILDHMGSTELAANLFRATQAEEKLRRDNVQTKTEANQTHFDVGQKVRQTIQELGGTMPENLPTPGKSVKSIETHLKKLTNKDKK